MTTVGQMFEQCGHQHAVDFAQTRQSVGTDLGWMTGVPKRFVDFGEGDDEFAKGGGGGWLR